MGEGEAEGREKKRRREKYVKLNKAIKNKKSYRKKNLSQRGKKGHILFYLNDLPTNKLVILVVKGK